MVDQFQAFLLLGLTAFFVYLVVRVVRDDQGRAKDARRMRIVPHRSQPPQ